MGNGQSTQEVHQILARVIEIRDSIESFDTEVRPKGTSTFAADRSQLASSLTHGLQDPRALRNYLCDLKRAHQSAVPDGGSAANKAHAPRLPLTTEFTPVRNTSTTRDPLGYSESGVSTINLSTCSPRTQPVVTASNAPVACSPQSVVTRGSHFEKVLRSFRFGKQNDERLCESDVQKVLDITMGWELADIKYRELRGRLLQWSLNPDLFWQWPSQTQSLLPADIATNCVRALRCISDDKAPLRVRMLKEVIYFVTNTPSPKLGNNGNTSTKEIADRLWRNDPSFETLEKCHKWVENYRMRGKKLQSIGFGMHFVVATAKSVMLSCTAIRTNTARLEKSGLSPPQRAAVVELAQHLLSDSDLLVLKLAWCCIATGAHGNLAVPIQGYTGVQADEWRERVGMIDAIPALISS